MPARIAFVLLALAFAGAAMPQKAPIFADSSGAIRGYDPVAYFSEARPVKGSKEFTYRWNGAEWRFASAENRNRFAAEPHRYAPQYGGYCAYGVAGGYTVKIEPDAWSIIDGKLYLNYDRGVQRLWAQDPPGYIRKADANWPAALSK